VDLPCPRRPLRCLTQPVTSARQSHHPRRRTRDDRGRLGDRRRDQGRRARPRRGVRGPPARSSRRSTSPKSDEASVGVGDGRCRGRGPWNGRLRCVQQLCNIGDRAVPSPSPGATRPPPWQGSRIRAGDGNRTRTVSLGSSPRPVSACPSRSVEYRRDPEIQRCSGGPRGSRRGPT
jgi:hypothetical protein